MWDLDPANGGTLNTKGEDNAVLINYINYAKLKEEINMYLENIIINQAEFKQINDNYYISSKGEVYSKYSKKIIKPLSRNKKGKDYLYVDIWNKELKKQVHMPIHILVYTYWIGALKQGEQVNHKDDNTLNNDYHNLYSGSQKENIQDCIDNNTRVGNVWNLTLLDKEKDKIISFCPASNFIEYSGHPCGNGSLKRMFSRNWFKSRYEILDYSKINNIAELKSVTTMADECKPVE